MNYSIDQDQGLLLWWIMFSSKKLAKVITVRIIIVSSYGIKTGTVIFHHNLSDFFTLNYNFNKKLSKFLKSTLNLEKTPEMINHTHLFKRSIGRIWVAEVKIFEHVWINLNFKHFLILHHHSSGIQESLIINDILFGD